MNHIWKPSVTVAAVIERNGHFLLVEEETAEGPRFNQPAGHLNANESLEDAVVRETLEETAYDFTPTTLIGVYLSRSQSKIHQVTYVRFAFAGVAGTCYDRPLDAGILRAVWMTYDEIAACKDRHRSPMLMQCMDDFLAGKHAPLSLLYTHKSALG